MVIITIKIITDVEIIETDVEIIETDVKIIETDVEIIETTTVELEIITIKIITDVEIIETTNFTRQRYNKPRNDDRQDGNNNYQNYNGCRNYRDNQFHSDRHYQPRYPPRPTTGFRKRREEDIQDSLGQLDTIKLLVRLGIL